MGFSDIIGIVKSYYSWLTFLQRKLASFNYFTLVFHSISYYFDQALSLTLFGLSLLYIYAILSQQFHISVFGYIKDLLRQFLLKLLDDDDKDSANQRWIIIAPLLTALKRSKPETNDIGSNSAGSKSTTTTTTNDDSMIELDVSGIIIEGIKVVSIGGLISSLMKSGINNSGFYNQDLLLPLTMVLSMIVVGLVSSVFFQATTTNTPLKVRSSSGSSSASGGNKLLTSLCRNTSGDFILLLLAFAVFIRSEIDVYQQSNLDNLENATNTRNGNNDHLVNMCWHRLGLSLIFLLACGFTTSNAATTSASLQQTKTGVKNEEKEQRSVVAETIKNLHDTASPFSRALGIWILKFSWLTTTTTAKQHRHLTINDMPSLPKTDQLLYIWSKHRSTALLQLKSTFMFRYHLLWQCRYEIILHIVLSSIRSVTSMANTYFTKTILEKFEAFSSSSATVNSVADSLWVAKSRLIFDLANHFVGYQENVAQQKVYNKINRIAECEAINYRWRNPMYKIRTMAWDHDDENESNADGIQYTSSSIGSSSSIMQGGGGGTSRILFRKTEGCDKVNFVNLSDSVYVGFTQVQNKINEAIANISQLAMLYNLLGPALVIPLGFSVVNVYRQCRQHRINTTNAIHRNKNKSSASKIDRLKAQYMAKQRKHQERVTDAQYNIVYNYKSIKLLGWGSEYIKFWEKSSKKSRLYRKKHSKLTSSSSSSLLLSGNSGGAFSSLWDSTIWINRGLKTANLLMVFYLYPVFNGGTSIPQSVALTYTESSMFYVSDNLVRYVERITQPARKYVKNRIKVLVPWVSMLIDKKNKGDDGSGGGSLVVNSSSGSLFYNIDRVRETIRTLLKCQLVQWLRTRSIETNNPEMDDCFGIFGDAHFVWSLDTPPISDIPLDQTTGNLDFVKLDQMSPVFCQKLIQLNIPAPPQLTTTKGSNSNNGDINKEYADTINKPDGGFYLHNINIKIPKGKLTLITGPTGCGKTSLLLALMGEMCCIKGNIKFPFELNTNFCPTISSSNTSGAKGAWELSGVGYVAQQPWIENTTIRENILFGSAMNKRRYLQVLEACALIVDIDDMEHRDLTLVGDNGVRLSGGQKQRINLARALYSDSRVLVIDDCLSAVDILTANHILFRCISRNGSEISVGRTVVLATNHVAMCAPVADSVVVVENGTVKAQGSTKELADQGVIMLDKEGSGELGLSNNKESEKLESDVVKDVDWLIDEEDTAGNSKHTTIHSSNADKYIDNELEQNDDRASTNFIKQNFSILYKIVVLCGGIWFLVKPALLTFIESFTNKIGDYWVGLLSSSISNSAKPTAVSSSTTTLLAMGPLGFVLGKTLIEVINTLSGSLRYSFTFDSDIYETHNQTILKKIMQNLANATPGFFQETPLNLISSEAFGTAYDIFEEFQEIFDSFLESLFEGLGIVVILVVSAPGSIVHLVIILAIYYVYSLHSIRMDNVIEDIQMSIRKTSIGTSKVIYSLKTDDSARATIRGFGMTQKHIDKEIEAVEANYSFGRFNSDYREQNAVCLKIISAFSNFFITYLLVSGLISVAHSGKMSASGKEDFDSTSGGGGQGSSGFVIKQSVLLSSFIWYMITDFMQFYTLRTSLRTLSKYVELPQELPAIIPENRPPLLWPASGNIKVKNLSSSYDKRTASVIKDSSGGGGGGADDHDSSEEPNGERSRPNSPLIQENKSKTTTPTTKTAVAKETRMVLKDVSFEIKGGEKVGIVGRTGAGKSTLVLTLLRFLEPKSSTTGNADGGGTIEIDGIDVTKIGLDDLRRNMTMIPQEPSLLQGTLRHNLDPFDEFEDDDLWDALLKIGIFKTKPTDNDDNADSNKAGESVNSSSDDCDSGSSGEDSIAKKKGAGKSKWRFLLKLKPRVINDLQAKLNGIAAKAFKYRKDVNRLYKSIKSLLLVWSKIMAIKALNRAHSVAVSCLPKNLYASGFLELIKMVSPHSGLAINEKQPSPSTNVSNINNPEYVSGTDTTDDSNDEEEDENQMFIDELEDQNTLKSLNTRINAGGKNLSLGQRQMITLARAMVRKSKILIMDEATASLDFETDKHIQKFLRSEAFSQTTMLCIAHRLQTIIDYDKVMVIDRGRVAEFDQPYKLLQNTESKFYEMCFKSGQFGMLYSMAEKKFKKSTVSNVLVN